MVESGPGETKHSTSLRRKNGHQTSSSVAMSAETQRHLASGGLDLEGDFDLDLGGDDEEAWSSCFFAPL